MEEFAAVDGKGEAIRNSPSTLSMNLSVSFNTWHSAPQRVVPLPVRQATKVMIQVDMTAPLFF